MIVYKNFSFIFVSESKTINMDFLKEFEEERNRIGLSQQDMADELDISWVHYHNIEIGKSRPTIKLLKNICKVLDRKLIFVKPNKA